MKYLKTYEKFIWTISKSGLVSHPDEISDDIKEIIEDRLTPINDILDLNGKQYDIYMTYIKPQLSFQNTWSNPGISIIIKKKGEGYLVELRDVIDPVMELISELKEHGYIFRQYNLKHMLNQVLNINDPRIEEIEKSFSNLVNHGCGSPEELFLSFEKNPDDLVESSEWIDGIDPFNGIDPSYIGSLNKDPQIWSEIEDILTPISDDVEILYVINNFSRPVTSSKSNILIRKDWSQIPNSREGERYFFVKDVRDEVNHLCSRFPDVINQIQLFRQRSKNPNRFTPNEFIKMEPEGSVFLIAITLKIQKEGAANVPPN